MAEAGEGLFGGSVRLRQSAAGHRVGTDAVLLAAAAPLSGVAHALDLGAGVGAVGLLLARREPALAVTLVERDAVAASLARLNSEENGLGDRVNVIERDGLAPWPEAPRADLVVTNPPWLDEGSARVTEGKRPAHVMPTGGLDAWVRAALGLLQPHGELVMIHRADALPAVLSALDRRFGGIAVRPILPREGMLATRVLVRGRKGSRAPFRLLAPLILHEPDGAFTASAAALHRGDALLGWD